MNALLACRNSLWPATAVATRAGAASRFVDRRHFGGTLRAVMLAWCAALAACAGLPDAVHRPVSQAPTDVSGTRLASVAAASMPRGQGDASGLRLLPDGTQALEARLALAGAAERTIDAQYYQIAGDASGRQFYRALRDAAARGVRVRVLIDDLCAAGQDEWLLGLAARPNVELRMFNPLAVRGGSVRSRVIFSLHDFSRVNRRMHNKLFVADNAFAISGGRNIADEYFGRGQPANFIDMDILSAGPVVMELSAVFDQYWNSDHAYPIQSLARPDVVAEAARQKFDASMQLHGPAAPSVTARDALDQTSVGSQLAAHRVDLHVAAVRVVADAPTKAASLASLADGDAMKAHRELFRSARSDVLVASPYFVPDRQTLDILRRATGGQLPVSVITNSLATTDEPLVHFGYARYRNALLAMGVALYELMPGTDAQGAAKSEQHGSLSRLHAKLAVVDHRWLSIGSMNMDRRSAHSNTEMGLIVDSPELAGQASALLQRERLARSYQVRRVSSQHALEWVGQVGADKVVFAAEPDANWALQLRLLLVSLFVSEDLL